LCCKGGLGHVADAKLRDTYKRCRTAHAPERDPRRGRILLRSLASVRMRSVLRKSRMRSPSISVNGSTAPSLTCAIPSGPVVVSTVSRFTVWQLPRNETTASVATSLPCTPSTDLQSKGRRAGP
jgi:hypothetical protein